LRDVPRLVAPPALLERLRVLLVDEPERADIGGDPSPPDRAVLQWRSAEALRVVGRPGEARSMTPRSYATPLAFKEALEQRLRTGGLADLSRRRQLLVFDRLLARVARDGAALREDSEDRRRRPAVQPDVGSATGGQHPREVFGDAAAGYVRKAFDIPKIDQGRHDREI